MCRAMHMHKSSEQKCDNSFLKNEIIVLNIFKNI